MTYHLKIKNRTDAFTCRKTGFYVNCYRPEAKTDTLTPDIKTVVRSGRVLDLNGAVLAVLEAEKAGKENQQAAIAVAPEKPVAPKEEAVVVAPVEEPVAPPQEDVAPEPAFELAKATKDELFAYIKEKGWTQKDVGVTNKTTQPKLVAAIQAYEEAERN